MSIGTIGLIKAVNTFTPERSIKLATYASRCIGNEILMYLRKSSNRRQEASIDEPLNIDGEDSWISGLQFRQTVAGLTPREKRIMELRYLKGKTQMEVAREIGISQAQVSRLEKAALEQFHQMT